MTDARSPLRLFCSTLQKSRTQQGHSLHRAAMRLRLTRDALESIEAGTACPTDEEVSRIVAAYPATAAFAGDVAAVRAAASSPGVLPLESRRHRRARGAGVDDVVQVNTGAPPHDPQWGPLLRAARGTRYSPRQLGKALGVSRVAVQEWEEGAIMTDEIAQRLRRLLGETAAPAFPGQPAPAIEAPPAPSPAPSPPAFAKAPGPAPSQDVFGHCLRAARLAKGLSQSALARHLGTRQSAVARLEERVSRPTPSVEASLRSVFPDLPFAAYAPPARTGHAFGHTNHQVDLYLRRAVLDHVDGERLPFPAALRSARIDARLSAASLAKKMGGASEASVYAWEAGTGRPKQANYNRLLELLPSLRRAEPPSPHDKVTYVARGVLTPAAPSALVPPPALPPAQQGILGALSLARTLRSLPSSPDFEAFVQLVRAAADEGKDAAWLYALLATLTGAAVSYAVAP
jgi:transcriptional regulator with XRE-family HTH domain